MNNTNIKKLLIPESRVEIPVTVRVRTYIYTYIYIHTRTRTRAHTHTHTHARTHPTVTGIKTYELFPHNVKPTYVFRMINITIGDH
jgi:hypothetical protein